MSEEEIPVKAGRVDITIYDLVLPVGLKLDRVTLRAGETEVKGNPLGLKMAEPAELIVEAGEAALTDFVRSQVPNLIKSIDVSLEDGKLLVRAEATVILTIEARAVCSLRIDDQRKLMVVLEDVDKGGPVRGILENQIDGINPVFDAAELPFPVTLDRAEISDQVLRIYGTAAWPMD